MSAQIVNECGWKPKVRTADFEVRISLLALAGSFADNLRMSSVANVTIHSSQFPESVRRDLLDSLRTGEINHKFHYDSVKQAQKWLALHEAYSPSRTDPDCAATYERGFAAAAKRIEAKRVHLIGLGCGGGQKDARLLRLLQKKGREVFYTPSDVSSAMVLVAREAALKVLREQNCYPLVCDLASARDLPQVIEKLTVTKAARIITFFGMIPNFEPDVILPRLFGLLRSEDRLLFSANLASGADYAAGVRKILPLYDNALTRDWLATFLTDLGVEAEDGEVAFGIEDVIAPNSHGRAEIGLRANVISAMRAPRPASMKVSLKRVTAHFRFNWKKEIKLGGERFRFGPKKPIRLFYSYRYTPTLVRSVLGNNGITVLGEWITKSEEEGVFLCKRTRAQP